MFAEVKELIDVSGDAYDAAIILQIRAAALDLTTTAEINMPGEIDISRNPDTGVITDNSTVTDEKIIDTIATWCKMKIGNPPNYDKLLAAYNSLKGSLRLSKHYTTYTTEQGA